MRNFARIIAFVAAAGVTTGCGESRKIDYSIDSLVKSLKDKDSNMRYWAAQSLGSFGPKAAAAVPDLIESLGDEQKMVRMGAAYSLGEIGQADALPALRRAATEPEEDVRAAASFAIFRIQSEKRD